MRVFRTPLSVVVLLLFVRDDYDYALRLRRNRVTCCQKRGLTLSGYILFF